MCKILNPRVLKIITSVWMCRMLWTSPFKILIWNMPDLLWMCQMVKTSIFKIFMLNTPRVNCYPLAFITFSRQLFQSASIDRSVVCLSQTTSVWLALLAYFKYQRFETIVLNQSKQLHQYLVAEVLCVINNILMLPKNLFFPFKLTKNHSELVGVWFAPNN